MKKSTLLALTLTVLTVYNSDAILRYAAFNTAKSAMPVLTGARYSSTVSLYPSLEDRNILIKKFHDHLEENVIPDIFEKNNFRYHPSGYGPKEFLLTDPKVLQFAERYVQASTPEDIRKLHHDLGNKFLAPEVAKIRRAYDFFHCATQTKEDLEDAEYRLLGEAFEGKMDYREFGYREAKRKFPTIDSDTLRLAERLYNYNPDKHLKFDPKQAFIELKKMSPINLRKLDPFEKLAYSRLSNAIHKEIEQSQS